MTTEHYRHPLQASSKPKQGKNGNKIITTIEIERSPT
jgi:hypothetical protein